MKYILSVIFDKIYAIIKNRSKKFKIFFIRIASKDYKFEYNKTISLNEQKLLPQTKGILALIYRDYLCNDEEKINHNCNGDGILGWIIWRMWTDRGEAG